MTNHIIMILRGHYFSKWESKNTRTLDTILWPIKQYDKFHNWWNEDAYKSKKCRRLCKYELENILATPSTCSSQSESDSKAKKEVYLQSKTQIYCNI